MSEMILDAAKSISGRTEWRVDADGCLTEVGPHSMKFTLSAKDTRLLLLLLERQKDVILAGASLEQKTLKHGVEAMGEDACF